jgi:hypothetical protein
MTFKKPLLLLVILLGVFSWEDAHAATAYFSPASGSFSAEDINVDILIDTEGVAINNAEVAVRFPNNLLEIVSTSASDSIFSLWVGAPKFSNEAGTLSFTAGMPTPGFTGDAGKILSVVFRIKGKGSASLTFSSVVIRANDGYGTNIFKSGARATFDLASDGKWALSGGVLNPPVFTDYPKELQTGEQLVVHGSSYKESTVSIWIQKDRDDQQNFTVESDREGRFTFSPEERVQAGVYRLWAEAMNSYGSKSEPTEKIAIIVVRPTIDSRMVLFVVLGIIILFVVGYGWRSYILSKKRLRKETLEAESSLHKAFGSLRENRERLEMFEAARTKRKLTAEEEKIVTWLKRDLDNVEETVEKEIEDIEEEIK